MVSGGQPEANALRAPRDFSILYSQNHFAALGLRCGQPGQQHGLELPSTSSFWALAIRLIRVSGFFADVTQQIHSFLARGVMASHAVFIAESESMALRKSVGNLWTGPEMLFVVGWPGPGSRLVWTYSNLV